MQNLKKLPSVVSINRSVVVSDGLFHNMYEDRFEPVLLDKCGWRGVQNKNNDTDKEKTVNNIGVSEIARLESYTSILKVGFMFKPVSIVENISQVNDDKDKTLSGIYRSNLMEMVERSEDSLNVLARMVVINMFNARWTWRNRIVADDIKVTISVDGMEYTANAFDFSLNDFNNDPKYDEMINNLSELMSESWLGNDSSVFTVSAVIDFGVKGAEVFPSQRFLNSVPKGEGHFLYNLKNHVAYRDAKIWNALRTVDIWYPEVEEYGPIPTEPVGSNLAEQKKFRMVKSHNLFHLLKNMENVEEGSDEWLFVLMCLIQGGLLTDKTKD